MWVCGGWAHCVCLYLATNKRPAPCPCNLLSATPKTVPPFLYSPVLKNKTDHHKGRYRPFSVAGCTTGSSCPVGAQILKRTEVLVSTKVSLFCSLATQYLKIQSRETHIETIHYFLLIVNKTQRVNKPFVTVPWVLHTYREVKSSDEGPGKNASTKDTARPLSHHRALTPTLLRSSLPLFTNCLEEAFSKTEGMNLGTIKA